jgi:hypothetical protein
MPTPETILAPTIATAINREHQAAIGAARSALQHARRAGELLIEAKAGVEHGAWLPWLSEHCPNIGVRQAQKYMRLAEGWPAIEANTNPDSHLTIDGAVRLLAEPRELFGDEHVVEGDEPAEPWQAALLRFRRIIAGFEHEDADAKTELELLQQTLDTPTLTAHEAAYIHRRAETIEAAARERNVRGLYEFGRMLESGLPDGWVPLMRELLAKPEAIRGFVLVAEQRRAAEPVEARR